MRPVKFASVKLITNYSHGGISSYNELLMRLIDEEYTRHPFYGRGQIDQLG
ncbi:MAG: hypothetical protein ACOX1Z_02160 [Candidatus Ratteibacteria bacterium]